MNTKLRLLIVEDNPIAARVLKTHGEQAGFTVDHAPTVSLASRLLLTHRYHVIFMDLGLEDGDGKTLTEWIRREDNPNQHTPVIVVSAHMNETLKKACLAAGANEVLVKPVQRAMMEQLLKTISREAL
jgi:DNA-binding response OmpR family regulator